MKHQMFGLAAAAAVSLSLLTGCPAEEKKETTTTTTTTTTTEGSPAAAASADAHGTTGEATGTHSTTTTTTTSGSPAAAASADAHGTTGTHGSTASAAPAAGASTPAKTETAAAAGDGAAVFSKNNCAACHGAKGEGGVGPNLQKVEAKGDEHIKTTIRNGKGNMPKFDATQISDEQLKGLIAYVKSL